MKALKQQAWFLLTVTAATFGKWQHSWYAGVFFFVGVLLVGTIVTGYKETYK